jgi:Cu(I)/Ag(I) efflux system membrane fusion protein
LIELQTEVIEMSKVKPVIVVGVLVVFPMLLAGCSEREAPSAMPESNAGERGAQTANDQADHERADKEHEAASAEVTAALAELPAEDRMLAEKQRICPVSGELLGSMGAPIKVDVEGQPVFICCEGCKEELLAKPEEYLAKLKP